MTRLLASVTGPAEAELALAHGADIIDLKDPARGALGALEPAAVRAVVARIAGQRPTSAACGDLPMEPDIIVAAAASMTATGVDYVKVGLFDDARRLDCIRALAPLARGTRLIGVMFADAGMEPALLAQLAAAGFAGVMLDTAHKGRGRLLDHVDLAALEAFVRSGHAHGLLTGLAGSLEAPDVPRLLLLEPDYLGFRGALCAAHDRTAGLDPSAIGVIRALIPRDARAQRLDPVETEPRPHPMRASADRRKDDDGSDRVFVHDLVLPVRIGVYARERMAPQDVRFNVDVEISRGRSAQDMRDVMSYDIIIDAIRLIVASGHIPLVETLADRIAGFLLGHPRAQNVTVRVEKLAAGPASVGVEIRRRRPADIAKVYHLYPAAAGDGRASAE
ncbi:MAG: dihydroneopterin aldolase [Alphaproteobacteria bacterium]|nr:dihydroneopterin aldolase [Alphaproteobacteria bacterium]